MRIRTIMRVKWSALKRTKFFYFFIFLNYFFLAMVDTKSLVLMPKVESYIFRYLSQQIWIVITSTLFIYIIFNKKNVDMIKNYMIIYVEKIETEIYGIALICIIVNVVALFIGQIFLLIINFIYYGKVLFTLFVVNFIIVSLEIVISTLIQISLRLYFKKNIFVFGIFYIFIIAMLMINNVFVTIPLTIKILGIGGESYYTTYGWQLWFGRAILLIISYGAFRLSINKFKKELKNV